MKRQKLEKHSILRILISKNQLIEEKCTLKRGDDDIRKNRTSQTTILTKKYS